VKTSEILMTPADAATLLRQNTRNRKLVHQRVTALTAAIARGEWIPDGNPVKVSVTEVILDGQHRLAAVAAGDIAVPVVLMEGLPDEAQMVMDSGRARTFADYLTIRGIPNERTMASAVRFVWNYQSGIFGWKKDWFARPMPTNQQLWDLFKRDREILEIGVNQASLVLRVVRTSRAVVSGAWVVLSQIECSRCGAVGPDLDEFYEALAMRKACNYDSVTSFIRLMNSKHRDEKSALTSGYSQHVQTALLIKAWNAYREGRPVATLRYTLGGAKPEPFPVPH